jgi:hypothetical protein
MVSRCVLINLGMVLVLLGSSGVSQATGALITSFQSAFQPNNPAPGWDYLWNNAGPIGNPVNYTALLPTNGGRYRSDGTENSPSPAPAAFIAFQRYDDQTVGGHPGTGESQSGSAGIERYAIAVFTVATSDSISIVDGLLRNINPNFGGSSDGLNLKVYVNNDSLPVISAATGPGFGSQVTFNGALGALNAGDKIYVAIGSKDSDLRDGFALEYDIVSVPETNGRALFMIGAGLTMILTDCRSRRGIVGRSIIRCMI